MTSLNPSQSFKRWIKIYCTVFLFSDFLSSCRPQWSWTNTCHWRLFPGRGQVWSKVTCVGCLGGATTVWVEARSLSRSGRSRCPLFQPQGATAATPSMVTSQQTWSVLGTGPGEKMHARYRRQTDFLLLFSQAHWVWQAWLFDQKIHFWNDKFSKVLLLVPTVYQITSANPLFIILHYSKTITQFWKFIPLTVWGYSSSCQYWFDYKLLLSRRGSPSSTRILVMKAAAENRKVS